MKNFNSNLFEVLMENGYNAKDVASKLKVKVYDDFTVFDFMKRFQKGGMHHKYFKKIYDLCIQWRLNQLNNTPYYIADSNSPVYQGNLVIQNLYESCN